ncbi:MAG: hypothetical protein ACLUI7_07925 [Coprococcus sp.]
MEVSVETCWKSLNKIHEELCGDKVEILRQKIRMWSFWQTV